MDWRLKRGGLERELPAGCPVDTGWKWLGTTGGQVRLVLGEGGIRAELHVLQKL